MGYFNTVGVWVPDPYLSHEGRSIDDGAKIGSGRYRKGSGKRPNQHVGKTGAFAKNYSSPTRMAKEVGEAYRAEREVIKGNKDALDVLNRRTIRKLSSDLDVDEIAKSTGIDKNTIENHLSKFTNREIEKTLDDIIRDNEKPYADLTDEDIDRYAKLQKKISDESVDWYDGIPKSKRAKQLYKESEEKENKVEETLGKRYRDLIQPYVDKDNKLVDEYWDIKRNTELSVKKKERLLNKNDKKRSKINDIVWNDKQIKESRQVYEVALDRIKSDRDRKLVDVVLRDLGMAVNNKNRQRILDSYVLFWD